MACGHDPSRKRKTGGYAVRGLLLASAIVATVTSHTPAARFESADFVIREYDVPAGSHPHDVAPTPEPYGPVWYTAQHRGELGRLDPRTGKTHHIPLGLGSRPHGVIVGADKLFVVREP